MLPQRRHKNSDRASLARVCQAHQKWVRGFACSMCGHVGTEGNPIVAAHVRLGTGGGTGMRPSDRWIVSLCDTCHKAQHDMGEPSFWALKGINPKILAEEFARKSPHWPRLREMA